MVGPVMQALLATLLIVLMAGMGATLTPSSFRSIAKRPRGVLIGVASQFGWMPLVAFGLAKALELPPEIAVGLILVGCTPGGTTSNLFTYYARADVALSVSMTAISTTTAVVLMPLLLTAYAGSYTSEELTIPLGKIVVTLALVLVPVALGMALRARRGVDAARKLELAGSVSGVVVLVLLIAKGLFENHTVLLAAGPGTYLATVGLGAIGMTLGWFAARLAGLDVPARRAVAFETGIQNSPLAIAIVIAAFEGTQQETIVAVPLMYALFVLVVATVVTGVFRLVDRRGGASDGLPAG